MSTALCVWHIRKHKHVLFPFNIWAHQMMDTIQCLQVWLESRQGKYNRLFYSDFDTYFLESLSIVQWIFIWTHWQFPRRETQWVASTPAGKLLWRLRNGSDGFRRLKNFWWVEFQGKRCCFYSSNGRVAELYSDINLAADVMARSASTSYLKPHRQTRFSFEFCISVK